MRSANTEANEKLARRSVGVMRLSGAALAAGLAAGLGAEDVVKVYRYE
jgi:hypothetical protein